ncbi:unnamed protein product, partial [Prorocentrum cordatum]
QPAWPERAGAHPLPSRPRALFLRTHCTPPRCAPLRPVPMGGGVGKAEYRVQFRRSVDSAGQYLDGHLAAWVARHAAGGGESRGPAEGSPESLPGSTPRPARGRGAAGAVASAASSAPAAPNTVGPTLLRSGREGGGQSHEGGRGRRPDRSAAGAASCDRGRDTSKDGRWHQKHCSPGLFVLANTIQQAYPFDPYGQKTVYKEEEHLSSMCDHWRGFGEVTITKTGPRKLHCRICARLLVDADDSSRSEGPFYFCRRCHESGYKYHICTSCWQDLKRGDASPFDVHAGPAGPGSSTGSEAATGISPAVVPPGLWKGSVTEGGYTRDASLNLSFDTQGGITGSGPAGEEEVAVSGVWRREGRAVVVAWSEARSWGRIWVDGQFMVSGDAAKITAKMLASDEGQASLVLSRRL